MQVAALVIARRRDYKPPNDGTPNNNTVMLPTHYYDEAWLNYCAAAKKRVMLARLITLSAVGPRGGVRRRRHKNFPRAK
jgi:hypothetical protein